MKKQLALLVSVSAYVVSSAAHAEIGLSASLGTTGLGLHASVPLNSSLSARFGGNYLNYSFDRTTSNIHYDYKLKLRTVEALLDWFPLAGQFRITGGVAYNDNKLDGVARPNSSLQYTFNGVTYNAADVGSVTGRADVRKFTPYLGIGWGGRMTQEKGWGMSADLGVLFQGSPSASLNAVCGPALAALPGGCAVFRSNVAVEERNLNEDMKDYKYYPVARISAIYRF